MSPNTKKIIIALPILLILGYFGYTMYFGAPADTSTEVTAVDGGTTSGQILGGDILIMVEKLRLIKIDASVFSGAEIINLQDLSTAITPELAGRPNPFVPLGTEKTGK